MKTRQEAYDLLTKYNKDSSLINHALAVEAVMRYFAKQFGEDEEYWGNIGLVHDLDYELYPEEHCHKTKEIMEQEGIDEDIINSVMSHGWQICTDIKPEHKMELVLYTIDELTGLIAATFYVRPSKSILDLKVKSVKKKFKSSGFAAGVDRRIILLGCEMLDMDLDTVILWTIEGMRTAAEELGLKGEL